MSSCTECHGMAGEKYDDHTSDYCPRLKSLKPPAMPQPNTNTLNLCTSCNTMKHLNESGLCGRCEPNTNKRLGLPFGKMRKLRGAFDVDGTLRCNCTDTCQDPNEDIVSLFKILTHSFKNIELYVWSGGGKEYAERFARLYDLPIKPSHCISKFGAPEMDFAVDDIQDTAIAALNFIVRVK